MGTLELAVYVETIDLTYGYNIAKPFISYFSSSEISPFKEKYPTIYNSIEKG